MIASVKLLSISPRETSFEVRGFHLGASGPRAILERHGASFVHGYNAALGARGDEPLVDAIGRLPAAEHGFAYEGAAMALALLDLLVPGRRGRLAGLLSGPGRPHIYMVHVGAGWALARLRLRPRRRLPALDPFLRWLALDGYGFHEGFFHADRAVADRMVPGRLRGYERRVFDQGLGRALWFAQCAEVERVARSIARFPVGRRADLWSGLALAAAYTEAADADRLAELRLRATGYDPHVAQGAAFAVAARHRAGNVVDATRRAAAVLCECTVAEVVELVTEARRGLPADLAGDGYERWRARLGERLSGRRRLVAR